MQWISIKVRISVHESTAGALVEERLDAKVVDSVELGIWTAATLDVEPPRLHYCNTYQDNDNHVTRCRYIVAFFSLKTTQSVPTSAVPRPEIHSINHGT